MDKSKTPTSSGIAYSYIRFSRPEQMKGDSLRRQTQDSVKYAAKHGLRIDTTLHLQDLGVSAFRGKNATEGALAGFLLAVQSGKVVPGATLLVESLDRLSREQITVALTQFLNIINAGITVVTLIDEFSYNQKSINENPGSLMMSIVFMMRAHDESLTKGKRVGAAWGKKRDLAAATKKPLTKMCPEWLELTENGYTIRPDRGMLVKRIFQMSADGHGKRSIAKTFNQEGIPTWSVWATEPRDPETGEFIVPATPEESRKGKLRGNGWHDSYIQKILNSEAVLGIFQPHKRNPDTFIREPYGEPIEGYFPPVITLELWEKARRRPVAPRGPRKIKIANLFSGIVYDGYTGAVMRFVDKGHKDKKNDWRYLQSDITRLKGTKSQTWPYTHFEKSILTKLRTLDWGSLVDEKPDTQSDSLRTKEAELAWKSEKLRKDMDKVIRNFIAEDTPQALQKAAKANAAKIAEELENVESQLSNVRESLDQLASEKSAMAEGLDEFRALIDAGDPKSRIRLQMEIRKRLRHIVLYRHGGHPDFAKTEESTNYPMPTIEITYANGARQIHLFTRIGPAEHHANRQYRDPVTNKFGKRPDNPT